MYRELIAEEQGVDLSDQTLPTKEDYMSDKYQCLHCDAIAPLSEYKDTECDGDITGICPHCHSNAILLEVRDEEEDLIV